MWLARATIVGKADAAVGEVYIPVIQTHFKVGIYGVPRGANANQMHVPAQIY